MPIKAKTSTSWHKRPKATSSFVLPNYAPPQSHDFIPSRHNKQPRLAKVAKQTKPVIINMNEGLTLISGNLQKSETEDPFDRVVVSSHIDNALFTSCRTLTGQNNTLSQSLKVCHNKFSYTSVAKSNHRLYPEPAELAAPAAPATNVINPLVPIESHQAHVQSVSTEYDYQNKSNSPTLTRNQDENKSAFEILQKMKDLIAQPLIPPTIYDSEPSQIDVKSP